MGERTPVYEARNVSKSYGSVVALENASLSLHAGEVIGLVGDNGAGKSTLVKILSGALAPDDGTILMDGSEHSWKSPRDALESGVETLYQDAGLCPDLTVSGNVFLGREIRRPGVLGKLGFLDKQAMEREAAASLDRAGIGFAGVRRTVDQFSGGQRQAVAIGRAVAWARKVVILDEPTNHLGARQAGEVLNVMRRAKEQGLGVIFISHTLPHVLEATDRVVVLRLGRVVADRPTSSFTPDSLLKVITGLAEEAPL
ncbi:sugar ABC transporter ATP-binding protein [Leucobacter sp. CSA1]|uniref:Sugar ABC transporter ATP-binding protein n=1 Tax=Leucobacter chromiisoli TaxID=2796471 RepID=A0A934Q795_9MICO|nr:ATP-binding cassette domain-containing protein [Leucobacter chromiisoli]MBK0419051.1 sugar ABC transporter ATP-binding protein [Leucobacter chromiisoli]